jgi:hypothetical protein
MPANYYIAVLSRHHLGFVDPAAQARFDALYQVLARLSLSQASRALEDGRVRDIQTNVPARWEPSPMVIPLGEAMRRRLDSPEYRAAVDAARSRYHFTLVDAPSSVDGS